MFLSVNGTSRSYDWEPKDQASFRNTGPRESPQLQESTAPLRKARARAPRDPSARRARAARSRLAGRAADGAVGGMARSQLADVVWARTHLARPHRRYSAIGETPSLNGAHVAGGTGRGSAVAVRAAGGSGRRTHGRLYGARPHGLGRIRAP